MKYYYEYMVIFKYYNGKSGKVKIRADNPIHLRNRFKQLYPSRTFIKYKEL